MSVLIKGMKMPTKCTGCPFVRDVGDYIFVGCELDVGLAVNRAFPYRHVDCPLVPVPPHGRLGDLDRLEAKWANCDHGVYYDKMNFVQSIQKAPTIIPEEGE